jgi:hypothetical protein
MQERRKQARKSLMAYSQVYDMLEGTLLGYLADLTPSGAMVIGENPVQVGRRINLKFELPELPDISPGTLTLPAVVVWCQPDVSPDFLNIGLEFGPVSPEQARVIQAIIEAYEFRRNPPRYQQRAPARR